MPGRVFIFILFPLIILAVITQPAIMAPFLTTEVTASPTIRPVISPTPSSTPDLFADVPVATPFGSGNGGAVRLVVPSPAQLYPGPAPAGDIFPLTPVPTRPLASPDIPPAPLPVSPPPSWIEIPRLDLSAPVEPVGMKASATQPGLVEWAVPDHRAAGWLNTSAPPGVPGNTVLAGHHNIAGEVFRNLWTLEAGDEIILSDGEQKRRYRVEEVLLVPDRDEPIAVRLANARYIQPTADERLTLVTCWPYESNSHRVIVTAWPAGHKEE